MGDNMKIYCCIIAISLYPTFCTSAESEYVYDVGSNVPHLRDVCKRPETSQAIIAFLNDKIGLKGGPPEKIIATRLETVQNMYGEIRGPTLTCSGTLQTAHGDIGPGKVMVRYPGPRNAPPRGAEWQTDADREAAEADQRNLQNRTRQAAKDADAKQRAFMNGNSKEKTEFCQKYAAAGLWASQQREEGKAEESVAHHHAVQMIENGSAANEVGAFQRLIRKAFDPYGLKNPLNFRDIALENCMRGHLF
jgi:hypothetical protein